MAETRTKASATGGWSLPSQNGYESLQYDPASTPATTQELGPEEVLVDMHAASLNYRDLAIANIVKSGPIPLTTIPNLVPGSDGAGLILAIGTAIPSLRPSLQPGTDVVTHMVPHLPDAALPGYDDIAAGLGQRTHGTLRRRGIFHHSTLVRKPATLNYAQGATLGCSALTAWNALMGLEGRRVKAGDWVLTQGTGGVSIAALQIAVAAGATVVATTSSDAKADRLRALGAAHVLNYRTQPDWGARAKKLTPDGRGVDHVVDVGGPRTLPGALDAVRRDGLVTVSGIVGGLDEVVPVELMNALWHICAVRGVLLGSRKMMMDMVDFIDEKQVQIAVDDVEFRLEDAKDAYRRLKDQKHFAKVVIKMD